MKIKSLITLCFCLGITSPSLAKEKDDYTRFAPTFFLDTTFGLTTYKSKLINSNDTGTGLSYSIGGHAGESHEYGFLVRTDSNKTSFLLNESSIATTWQDTILRYRMWAFYLGGVFSQIDLKVNDQGTDRLNVAASGYGGNVGFLIPINRIGAFYCDVVSVSVANFRNTLEEEIKAGTRMDIDLGAHFDITRELLDLAVGYKQRTSTISVGGSNVENYYVTYLGLRAALYF